MVSKRHQKERIRNIENGMLFDNFSLSGAETKMIELQP